MLASDPGHTARPLAALWDSAPCRQSPLRQAQRAGCWSPTHPAVMAPLSPAVHSASRLAQGGPDRQMGGGGMWGLSLRGSGGGPGACGQQPHSVQTARDLTSLTCPLPATVLSEGPTTLQCLPSPLLSPVHCPPSQPPGLSALCAAPRGFCLQAMDLRVASYKGRVLWP